MNACKCRFVASNASGFFTHVAPRQRHTYYWLSCASSLLDTLCIRWRDCDVAPSVGGSRNVISWAIGQRTNLFRRRTSRGNRHDILKRKMEDGRVVISNDDDYWNSWVTNENELLQLLIITVTHLNIAWQSKYCRDITPPHLVWSTE